MRIRKGSYGYLQNLRKVSLLKSLLLLAAVFAVYFAARLYFHTNKNVFSILAALGALPAGRSVVVTVMSMRARSASPQAKAAVDQVKGLDNAGFDLYLTGYEHAFSLSHAAVIGHRVAGLTEDEGTDMGLCRSHIEQMLEKDGQRGFEVRIFRDPDEYAQYLRTLVSETDEAGRTGADTEAERRAMTMLYSISL